MFYYILLAIIIIYLFLFLYLKIKHRFWTTQPVVHYYDLNYWFNYYNGILSKTPPQYDRYTNLNIIFKCYDDLSKNELIDCVELLKHSYLNQEDVVYNPSINELNIMFDNTVNTNFSLYYKNILTDNNNYIITEKKLISMITSKVLLCNIKNITLKVNYVDYLCVDYLYRKKDIAKQMIQTHNYRMRKKNVNEVFLFKREGELNIMVPLVYYKCYAYNIKHWKNNVILLDYIKIIKINKQNITLFLEFIKLKYDNFILHIGIDYNILIHRINNKNIIIYVVRSNDTTLACFIFKEPYTKYYNKVSIECIASINNFKKDNLFIYSFSKVIKILQERYEYMLIENLADNYYLINEIEKKHSNKFVSKMAYYFYNYYYPTIENNKSLIIC